MSQNANIPFGGGLSNPQSGNTECKQFVLVRADMSTAFTDDEYNSCLTALSDNLAVAVSFGINGPLRQVQLVSKTNLGALTFSHTRNGVVESWTVSSSSPHTIQQSSYDVDNSITPLLNTGTKIAEGNLNGQQFELFAPDSCTQYVLRRSSMSAPFTAEEYSTCVNEVNAGHSVVVQFASGGLAEAQLIQIRNDGALVFSRCSGKNIITYDVAPGASHTVSISTEVYPDPSAQLTIRAGGVDYDYQPTGSSVSINLDSAFRGPYVAKGGATVATLNSTIPGLQPGWCYTLTNSGTLTAGNLTVHENDLVCWDGSKWYRITQQYIIDRLVGGNSYDLLYAILDADGKIITGVNTEGDQFCTELSQYWFAHYWDVNNALHYKRTSDLVFAITDTQDKVIFGITQNGEFYLESQVIEPVLKHFTDNSSEFAFCILDSDNKVLFSIDKNGKYSIEHQVDDIIDSHFTNISHLVFAVCDSDQKVLFSIDEFGRIASDLLDDYIEDKLKDFTPIDTAYVDTKVGEERTRAENAEQSLRQAIDDINPTTVVGGTNNPDEEFLTSISSKITLKNNTNLTNSRSVVYVRKNDDVNAVISQQDTTYIITFSHNLNGTTLAVPSGCGIVFKGGCFYNGVLDGDDTVILSRESKCFGNDLTFTGTFNMPVIEAEYFMNSGAVNRLKSIDSLLSDTHFNKVILNAGHTYQFEPMHDGSWNNPPDTLLNLKSNTELHIDGILSVVPNKFTHYFAVCARNASNVKITGIGKISGDADTHDYSTITSSHEWCHGICIVNESSNIEVCGLAIENMPGDGIDIDGSKNPDNDSELLCQDIFVHNCTITHCGRQGISIEAVSNCDVCNCDISDIYRTSPMAAIDIEPWTSKRAGNIKISNIHFDGSFGIDITHADNVVIENVVSDNTRLLSLNDCSNVSVENASVVNTAPNKTLVEIFGTVENASMHNITCDCQYPTNAQLDGVLIDTSVHLGANPTITSGPAAGSTRMYYNQYQCFNGNTWVNL